MKLTVKTLKGDKFDVQVEDSHTVAQVKNEIVRMFVGLLVSRKKQTVTKAQYAIGAAAPTDGSGIEWGAEVVWCS